MPRTYKLPNHFYTFPCGHSGTLPDVGSGNDFAKWNKNRRYRKNKRKCGCLLFKFRRRLSQAKFSANERGYKPPIISVDNLIKMYHECNGQCRSCMRQIGNDKCVIDHNHKTGQVRGFVCEKCNKCEGYLKNFTDEELEAFYRYISFCRTSDENYLDSINQSNAI